MRLFSTWSEVVDQAAEKLLRGLSGSTFGGGAADRLPARGALGLAAKAAVDDGHADAVSGLRTDAFERDGDGLLAVVGALRLGLDECLLAPTVLAPLIDPTTSIPAAPSGPMARESPPTRRRASTSSA